MTATVTPGSEKLPADAGTPYRAPLVAFLVANVVSICGTRVSAVAIPWFVLVTTGSPVKTGLVAMAEMLPLVLSKAIGGPVIDRIGPRRVSVTADAASTVVVAMVPLLHALHVLSLPALLVLVGVAGALRGPGDAAKGTLIPDIADAAQVPLERVTGLESTTERLAGFLAFGLAGGLIALVGAVNALWIDAASFAVCAVLIRIWVPRRHKAVAKQDSEDEGSYWQRLRLGWQFLRKDRLLMPLILMITVTNLLDAAIAAVLIPVWIRDHGYGPGHTGMVLTAFFITATVFALVAAAIGQRIQRRLAFTLSFPGLRCAAVPGARNGCAALGGSAGVCDRRYRRRLHQPDHRCAVHRAGPAGHARPGRLAGRFTRLGRRPARRRPRRRRRRRDRLGTGAAGRRRPLPPRDHQPPTDEAD